MHEQLVNRLGDLSLPRKSVVRLTDRPAMTLDVYRGRKTTMQQQQMNLCNNSGKHCFPMHYGVPGPSGVVENLGLRPRVFISLRAWQTLMHGKSCLIHILYRWIENWLSPVCSSLYLFFFSFSPYFLSKISPQLYSMESSYFVYRLTMTSCIVGLRISLLLFVLACIYSLFLLSIFFVKDISTAV